MKRIYKNKKPTLDHTSICIQINQMGLEQTLGKTRESGLRACSTWSPESNINSDHILPLLDLCCAYVGDTTYSADWLAK
jgi:hypothetical protein